MSAFKAQVKETMALIEADSAAFLKLTNRAGATFESWAAAHDETLLKCEEGIRRGYPEPHQASAKAQQWESWLAYAEQQAAVATSFHQRARAVARVVLSKRGVRATEPEADARIWQQHETMLRWTAVSSSLREWLWQARGREKAAFGTQGA